MFSGIYVVFWNEMTPVFRTKLMIVQIVHSLRAQWTRQRYKNIAGIKPATTSVKQTKLHSIVTMYVYARVYVYSARRRIDWHAQCTTCPEMHEIPSLGSNATA